MRSILNYDYQVKLGDNFSQSIYLNKYENIKEIISCAAFCHDKDEVAIIDVGAHDGFFCTQLEQTLNTVSSLVIYSFEPTIPTFINLHHQLPASTNRIKIIPVALSDSSEWVSISYEVKDSMLAQIIPNNGVPRLIGDSLIGVTMPLDTFVQKFSVKPTLIKIDVEGFEVNVLRGAKSTIRNFYPAVCIEWNPETAKQTKSSLSEILELLSAYQFFYINDYEGQRLPFAAEVSSPLEVTWTCNLFCLPASPFHGDQWRKNLAALCRRYNLDLNV